MKTFYEMVRTVEFECGDDRRVSGEQLFTAIRTEVTLRVPLPTSRGESLYLTAECQNNVITSKHFKSLNLTHQITASKTEWEHILYHNDSNITNGIKKRRTLNSSLYVMTIGSGPTGEKYSRYFGRDIQRNRTQVVIQECPDRTIKEAYNAEGSSTVQGPVDDKEQRPKDHLKQLECRIASLADNSCIQLGVILKDIRDLKLYMAAGFCTFRAYIDSNRHQLFKFGHKKAERIVTAYEASLLIPSDMPKPEVVQYLTALASLDRDNVAKCWAEILDAVNKDESKVTRALVKSMIQKWGGHWSEEAASPINPPNAGHHIHNSNEYYTPNDSILTRVRRVFGGAIDTDPCTDEAAQQTVNAIKYFTVQSDGLKDSNQWSGNVYINPPYGCSSSNQGMQELFFDKAVREYKAGNAKQCILLLKASPGSTWFGKLFSYPIGWLKHRLSYVHDGDQSGKARFGSVVVYIGPDSASFVSQFEDIAYIAGRNSWCSTVATTTE